MMHTLQNMRAAPIKLYHSRLVRERASVYSSKCPFCKDGVLPMRRNDEGELLSTDSCLNCGQRVKYLDAAFLEA